MFSNQDNHIFTSNDYFIDNKSSVSKNIKYEVIDSGHFEKNNENLNYNQTYNNNYFNSLKNEYNSDLKENSNKINYGSIYTSGNSKNIDFPNKNQNEDSFNKFTMINNSSKKELNTNCNSNFQENFDFEKNYTKSNFSNENKNLTSENYKTNTHGSKSSKLAANKPNESFNYNSELKYYRDVVEKMHNEINTLNNKLNELDKTNSLSLSTANKPYKFSNFSNNSANFDITNEYNSYNSKRYHDSINRPYSDYKVNEIKLNYDYCTDLVPETIGNTFEENTSESVINKEDVIINTNNSTNNQHPNNYLKNYKLGDNSNYSEKDFKNNTYKTIANSNTKNRNEKEAEIDVTARIHNNIKSSNDKNTNKRVNKFKQTSSRSNSKNIKNNGKESKSKLALKSKQIQIPKSSKFKEIKSKSVSNKNPDELSEIQKQNQILQNQVKFLEKKLDDVNQQLNFDQIERRGKDYLRIELEKWKFKTEALSKNYLQTLNNMKKQILDDKAMFVENINTMQSENRDEIESLKNKYHGLFERQENKIKNYKKENEILKKKLSKVKEILI